MNKRTQTTLAFSILLSTFAGCTSDKQLTDEKSMENEQISRVDIPTIPLEEFFKNSEKSSYQISPDGKHYAYMAPYQSRMNVYVKEVGSEEAKRITEVTDRDIAGYTWANDHRILYLKDKGGDENFGIYGVDLDGSNHKPLTTFEGVKTQFIDDLEGHDEHILVGLNKRDARIFDPYRLNVNTGELELLYENPGNISSWMADHDGKLRLATTTDGVNTSILYRETEKDEFKPILTTNFKESMNPQFFTFDNKNLYAISDLGRDKAAAVIFDVEKGKEKEVLYQHPGVDISSISYSDKHKKLLSYNYTTDKSNKHFVDKETEQWFTKVEDKLEGYEVAMAGSNKAEDKFILRTYSDKSRGAYYFYDKTADSLALLDEVSPWIDEQVMADMKPVTYKSRDGKTINGYLTLPKGVEARNLPVVVNPHGGPWARDYWGFNPEVQFLANRGYAVLQMNFRGSTGYGKEFLQSSFKQWGQTMQHDITDGAKWLIEEGIADPERIAIYGGSYGGYATLAGLTYTPGLYACGVDYVGVSNLFTFMETIPPYWEQYLAMLYEMVGDPKTDSAMLAEFSPSLHADKIKAPLLIVQGANDPRVKKSESDQMVEALRERGVDVEYMVKDNEGHGFRNEENRFEFYRAMESFLQQHIGKLEIGNLEGKS
jgi:dipeptidyl aminopeptidase/acylaminoacyl peptidase